VRNASLGLLLIGFLSITSASELSAQSPATATPPPPLLTAPSPAPAPQIYYLTEPVWVTIGDKAYGFGTGTQFELVQEKGNRVVVRNGDYEFEVDRARVTSDYAVAKLAHDTEIAQQAMGSDGKRNRRKRQEVAELQAKLEAARKAEKERQAATRVEEERAAMERKAAAEAALASRVAEFKKHAANLIASTSLPASDFQELRTLGDVKELPAATHDKISALDERVRSFRENDDAERLIEACRTETATVAALQTRSKAAREIHANNAAAALADLNSFLQDNSSPPSDAQKDLWQSLVSIRTLCNRLENESKTHLERAQSLSSSGKAGDAIEEFQIAYRIFPDPKVADTIKQLRENSLGL
jgi:hypothetical protein